MDKPTYDFRGYAMGMPWSGIPYYEIFKVNLIERRGEEYRLYFEDRKGRQFKCYCPLRFVEAVRDEEKKTKECGHQTFCRASFSRNDSGENVYHWCDGCEAESHK